MYTPGMMGSANIGAALASMRQQLAQQQPGGGANPQAVQMMGGENAIMNQMRGMGGGGVGQQQMPMMNPAILQQIHAASMPASQPGGPPAWQQLQAMGMQGQGSAATNKAALSAQQMKPQIFGPNTQVPPGGPAPGVHMFPPQGAPGQSPGIINMPGHAPQFGAPGQQLGVGGSGPQQAQQRPGGPTGMFPPQGQGANPKGGGINPAAQQMQKPLQMSAQPGQMPISLAGQPGQIPTGFHAPPGYNPGLDAFPAPMNAAAQPGAINLAAGMTKPMALPPSPQLQQLRQGAAGLGNPMRQAVRGGANKK